jgi:D-alanine-D-alanine ligase
MAADAAKFGKVAVLMGGLSAEREVSLRSGDAVLQALLARQVDAHAVDVGRDVVSQLLEGKFDRAFIVLHGRGGEDGVIQGALETLGIPFTGSGVAGSALGMDKYRCKLLWQGLGMPTPEFVLVGSLEELERAGQIGFPLMVKPAHEGSSIGMNRVEGIEQLESAWQEAREYDSAVLVERWITGSEYTVSILGDEALPLIRLETPNAFYDYEAKYQSDSTSYICPCGLEQDKEEELQQLALAAFQAVGASDWGRVDLLLDEEQQPWLIEVNTVPGMTDHSLVPMAAKARDIDFEQLVWRILEATLERQ